MNLDRSKGANLLLVSSLPEPFVLEDFQFLSQHFQVRVCLREGWPALWCILRNIFWAQGVFCWFGSLYAFWATLWAWLLDRPIVIQLGGADTIGDATLNYGVWRSTWRRPLLRWMLARATRVLTVDKSLEERITSHTGLQNIAWQTAPTGYDEHFWQPGNQARQGILTVARCEDEIRLKVKGIDLFIEAARRWSEESFTAVGIPPRMLQRIGWEVPPNLRVVPPVSRQKLLDFYQRASVYCQPSRYEGLPNALCEAMLCGCVPVVSRTGAMPDLVEGIGLAFPPGDVKQLLRALQQARSLPIQAGQKARERIQLRYPKQKREQTLLDILASLGLLPRQDPQKLTEEA